MDTIDQFPADSPQAAELKKLIARRLESMGIGLPDDIMLELVITSINNGADANRIDQDLLYIFDEGDYDQDFSRWLFEEAVPTVLAPSRPHSRRSSMSQSKPSSRATSQERSDSRREKNDDKSRGRSRSERDDDSTKERRRSSKDDQKDRGREREKSREHRREKDYDKYKDSERSREKSSKESDRSRRDRDKRESERGREKDKEKDKHREKEKDKDRKSRHSSRSRSRSRNKEKESKSSRHRDEKDKRSRSDRDKDRRDRDRDRDRDSEKRKDRSRSRSPIRDRSRIDISEKQESAKSAENTANGVHQENEDTQLHPKKPEESNDIQMDESADQKNGYHEPRPNVNRPPPPNNAPSDSYTDSAAPTSQHPMPPYQSHHRGPPPGRFMRPPPPSHGRPHMPPGPPASNRYDGYHAGPGPSGNQYPATRPPPFRPPPHSLPGFNSQEAEPQPSAYVESEGPQSIPTFDEYPPAGHQAGAGNANEMDWSYYGGEGYGYYDGYNYEDPYAYYGSEYDSAGYYPGYDQNYYAPQPDPHYAQPYPRRKPFPFQRGAAPESSTATLLTLTPASEDTPRCRHWPFCHYDSAMGEQCKFWHPQTLCEKYPNCGNDDSSCRYIHPTYLHLKSNPTSNLYHTDLTVSLNKSNAGGSIQQYSSDQAASNAIPTLSSSNDVPAYQLSIPCRMGKSCVRPNCKFLHPGQTPQNGNYSAPPNPALACKFGTFCTNPNCRYQHPSKSERFSNLGKSNDEAVEKIETGEGWGKEKTGDFVPLF
ncbi:hypothetical protein BKA69DRAFT_878542 [Paraphysoderma sedebokerense]|nr:hypothetical protein BKA69DRAFT_878542 [Paraphysoderma sedebokerense]